MNDYERFYIEGGYNGGYHNGGGHGHNCGHKHNCGCGERRFNQLNTYTLDTQTVTVSDTCVA